MTELYRARNVPSGGNLLVRLVLSFKSRLPETIPAELHGHTRMSDKQWKDFSRDVHSILDDLYARANLTFWISSLLPLLVIGLSFYLYFLERAPTLSAAVPTVAWCALFPLTLRAGNRMVAEAGKQFEEACSEASLTFPDVIVVVSRDSASTLPFFNDDNPVRWAFEVFVITPDTENSGSLSC